MELKESNSEPAATVSGSGHDSVAIQVNREATTAATKKARKEDDRKKKEARIAASTKMAQEIFAAECSKCKALTEELSVIKCDLKKAERQLEEKERDVKDKEGQLLESLEKLSDATSALQAKKRVIDTLEKEVVQAKRVKSSGELSWLQLRYTSSSYNMLFSCRKGFSINILDFPKVFRRFSSLLQDQPRQH